MTQPSSRWPVPSAPADFVDRVMLDVHRERAKRRARRAMAIVAFACAAVVVLAWGLAVRARLPRSGDVTARDQRIEVEIAPGVLAVLERYAHVAWTAAGVTQDRGDVFYRLAPGAELRVSTPVGDIGSAGSCSRVRVDPAPTGGAAGSPVVFVSVAQGSVSLQQAGKRVDLGAGQYARVDASTIRTDADDASGEIAFAFAHERVRRLVAAPVAVPVDEPPPTWATPATSSRALPVRSAPRPKAVAPVVSASAAPSASAPPRVFLAPPCVCNPTVAICDCSP